MKKFISLLLCLILALSLVACNDPKQPSGPQEPAIPETDVSNFEYELSQDKDYVIVNKYIGVEEEVRVPEKIENLPVQLIEFGSFAETKVTTVVIPDSVLAIGDYAFKDCTNLTEVFFGDGITRIWPKAFEGCTALKKVELPKNLAYLDEGAFINCTALEEVVIPKTLTDWGMNIFQGCTSLTTITFEEGLKTIGGYATFWETPVETLTIPASVESIEEPFAGCSSIKSVTFLGDAPDIRGNIFSDANKDLTIYYDPETSGWDTSVLKDFCTLVAK